MTEENISKVHIKIGQIKEYKTYDEIVHLCKRFTYDVIKQSNHKIGFTLKENTYSFNSIYGIPRGGMFPALILSHLLNLPIVESSGINPNTLIIDDINDSGETIRDLKEWFGVKFKDASPFIWTVYKRYSSPISCSYGEIISDNAWIVFPWESK